ncbi:hypothetical protein GALMADRAFT_1280112 [Galerina marginata CBS 339.88]|uniref:Peptidase A1 domain-containing protein n=1 Tax=Galerina marginata (strain CBS 339.88) TaxID=685588 RepID=A0A067TG99_GALM3|nr:hypothetical protein GALMADRAFT_1280112 [Galerina marginata CBS 339.88]
MFLLKSHIFAAFLAFLVLWSNCPSFVNAQFPAPSQSTFLSIPITHTDYATNSKPEVHGSIIQQQHANRGIRRLAMMTHQQPPSQYDLLSSINKRILLLPSVHQRQYNVEEIAQALASYNHSGERSMASISNGSISPLVYKTADNANATDFSWSKPFLHSLGLDIEGSNIGYIGTVKFGSPPRDFRLLIDSGSADLWVGAEGCRGNDGGGCGNHTLLGSRSSSTFNASKESWAVGYVSGSVSGYIVQDDVSIAGLRLKNHTFGVAQNESSDFTPDSVPFDGLLGLGKDTISQQRVPTLLQSLYRAHLLPAPVASYKISRLADGKNDGELTLGAMNPKHYDPKTLVKMKNVNKFGYWGVAVGAVKIGEKDLKWSNRTVLLDTGTTLIIAPQHDVDVIHNHIPGAQYDGSGWTVPCNMTTTLSLTIGDQPFSVDPRDIAFYPVEPGSRDCISGIAVGGVGPFYLNNEWLVGDVFLKNVYFSTDENMDEICIAKQT